MNASRGSSRSGPLAGALNGNVSPLRPRRTTPHRATLVTEETVVGGRTVRFARIRPIAGDGESRRPLVWLHGWSLSPTPYLPSLRAFSAQTGRNVVAVALPGFGGSDTLPLRHQGVSGIASHILELVERLRLAQASPDGLVDFAGHSFGGALSLRVGATAPDLAGSLSLYCPAGGSAPAIPLPKVLAGVAADGIHRWTPAALGVIVPNLSRHPLAFVGSGLAAWKSNQMEDIETVSEHGLSTTFVFAEDDGVVSPGQIPHTALPGVKVEWVPGRHSWLLTDPADFVTMLKRHQDEHGAHAASRIARRAI